MWPTNLSNPLNSAFGSFGGFGSALENKVPFGGALPTYSAVSGSRNEPVSPVLSNFGNTNPVAVSSSLPGLSNFGNTNPSNLQSQNNPPNPARPFLPLSTHVDIEQVKGDNKYYAIMNAAKKCNMYTVEDIVNNISKKYFIDFDFLNFYVGRLSYLQSKNMTINLVNWMEVRFHPQTTVVHAGDTEERDMIFPAWMLPEIVKSVLEKHYNNDTTWQRIIIFRENGWDLYCPDE